MRDTTINTIPVSSTTDELTSPQKKSVSPNAIAAGKYVGRGIASG
jgi:hypothetical protein